MNNQNTNHQKKPEYTFHVEASLIETVYICQDQEQRGCGLVGKLVAYASCGRCMYSSSPTNKGALAPNTKIYYN